jgi:DNA-binding beta-propeller fold protein YncE
LLRATILSAVTALGLAGEVRAAEPTPLVPEAKIPLGAVSGRIDHLAFDAAGQRLFVAERGNDSVDVVDLRQRQVVRRLSGLREPQGMGWHPATATLYVANAGDGSVRLYQGADLVPAGRLELGDDADNVRLDMWRDRIVVGYGKGALAVIDPQSRRKIGDIALMGHPEGFQFDPTGARIFVNVPDAQQIAVVDVTADRETSSWDTGGARSNFPMAIDAEQRRVLVAFRSPRQLKVFSTDDGRQLASVDTCGDSDDVFVDLRRHRVYVTCGAGAIDIFAQSGTAYGRIARIPTASGARTSLFVPENDRFYLAVRATAKEPAAIWAFRPEP